MRIEDLGTDEVSSRHRVAATVTWEDCDRAPQRVFFETEQEYAPYLSCSPHAFLVASLMPALQIGERRILIGAEVCPELLNGLETNMRWYQLWSEGLMQPLRIECARSREDLGVGRAPRVGSFLSGGVDSLATLLTNRLDYPRGSSASIRDCIMVHGFDIGGTARSGSEEAAFGRALAALEEIAADAGVTLVPVRTNLRLMYDDVDFWMHYFHGAALASVGHSLGKRLSRLYTPSSLLQSPVPWGSHPTLDPNYSSQVLEIRHEGLHLSRLEKVRRVADWSLALRNLRVCTLNPETSLNCGRCEKCVRTMLELLAVGKLEEATSFSTQQIDLESLEAISLHFSYEAVFYRELIGPLNDRGHHEIAEVLEAKLAALEKRLRWEREEDWKGAVKRFDRRWLGSSLIKAYKLIRSGSKRSPGSELEDPLPSAQAPWETGK